MFMEIWEESGVKPPMLLEMPMLTLQEMPFYDAFQALSNSRSYGEGGPDAISMSEMIPYLREVLDTHPQDLPDSIQVIQKMDIEFCNHHRMRIKEEMDRISKK